MKKSILLVVTFLFCIRLSAGDDFCGIRNYSFQNGESITYTIFYSVIGVYVNAGTAIFSVATEKINHKEAYHITAIGNSNPHYDWIFKVRDKYESFIDTVNLQPSKFIRDADEGGYTTVENVIFDKQNNTATSEKGTIKVPNCVQDVLSTIYFARNIDFNKYKADDKIPFEMYLDNQVYSLFIRYQGKEEIKTRYGKFRTIKLKPLLLKGNIFAGGEKMSIWLSDDGNHIPLRIESPIAVGTIKIDMMDFKNLRYPLTSLIEKR